MECDDCIIKRVEFSIERGSVSCQSGTDKIVPFAKSGYGVFARETENFVYKTPFTDGRLSVACSIGG